MRSTFPIEGMMLLVSQGQIGKTFFHFGSHHILLRVIDAITANHNYLKVQIS